MMGKRPAEIWSSILTFFVKHKWLATFFVILFLIRISLVLIMNTYVDFTYTEYVECAHRSIAKMFTCFRPFTYPTIIRLLSFNMGHLILFQTVLSSVSWIFLAYVLSKFFRNVFLRWASFFIFYVLSLSTQIFQWDYLIYSESVSLALYAATIASILLYASTRARGYLYLSMVLFIPFFYSCELRTFL